MHKQQLPDASPCLHARVLRTQVRDRLATLSNVRRHKMQEGLQQIAGTATVRVNGLGGYELNLIRQHFTGTLDMFLRLEAVRPRLRVLCCMLCCAGWLQAAK